jgi:hypothetical protein
VVLAASRVCASGVLQAELRPANEALRDVLGAYRDELGGAYFETTQPVPMLRQTRSDAVFLFLADGEVCTGTFALRQPASFWHFRVGVTDYAGRSAYITIDLVPVGAPQALSTVVYSGPVTGGDEIVEILNAPFRVGSYHIVIRNRSGAASPQNTGVGLMVFGVHTSDALHARMMSSTARQ